MLVKSRSLFLLLAGLSITIYLINACTKDNTSYSPTPYSLEIPEHFPQMIVPDTNPFTVEGIQLGRKLFYENALSRDYSINCGSCHSPNTSFSDHNQFSKGVDNKFGNRNSMALINIGWQQFYFWDGRASSLEHQIFEPIRNPVEMDNKWSVVTNRLSEKSDYRNAFYKAFGKEKIDSNLVVMAIAQFLRTFISANSKFDVIYKKQNKFHLNTAEEKLYQTVTSDELAGYDLFKSLNGADCFHCHNGPLMQVQKYSNNGLDNVFLDSGRALITKSKADVGKFKVPTLRNIALSAPYMHDGRFQTLDDVITHYSTEIKKSPTIDPLIEFANQGGVQLNAIQRKQLKAFLNTLTDISFVTNPNFMPLKN